MIMPERVSFWDEFRRSSPQPEIGNFEYTVPGDENVGRFQIAMDDLMVVRISDGPGDFLDPFDRVTRRLRLAGQFLFQAAAVDIFHDDEGSAGLLENIEYLH